MPKDTMLERMGGESGCMALAKEFYQRVGESAELKPLFPGKSLRCATEEFSAFLIQLLEGDEAQTQYRWWLSLRESHARFEITEPQRREWLLLMGDAISALWGSEQPGPELLQFFGAVSGYVAGKGEPGRVANEELASKWEQQRSLDQLAEYIAHGRDSEGIALAARFRSSRTVTVGILARMMEPRRESLTTYVLEELARDPALATSRSNGRSLLHQASGSAALRVVEAALAIGTPPDLLDSGGHTPLFRAAGVIPEEGAALVVEALIRAGADPNSSGGASRSTPLHQAARFGNVATARVLIQAGADPSLQDRSGFTPLARAINCRRPRVAEYLQTLQPQAAISGSQRQCNANGWE